MHDLIKELRAVEQALRKVLINSEMRQLGDIVTRLEAAVATPPPDSINDRLDSIERRHMHDTERLNNLAAAMREVARRDAIHPSVKFLADTIALNLGGPARG